MPGYILNSFLGLVRVRLISLPYHAAEALVFERTGKIAKTHRGVRAEFLRLTRTERLIERPLLEFLARAYELKAMADYGTGAEAVIPVETAKAAFETAGVSLRW